MKLLLFVNDIFRKFTLLFIISILVLGTVGIVEATSIFTLVPIIELYLKSKAESIITLKAIVIMNFFGLKVTVENLVIIFLALNLTVLIFQVFSRYLIQSIRYAVIKDIYYNTFKDFFRSSWYFFAKSKQGVLLNTFLRESTTLGDAFDAMANFFAEFLLLILYCILPFYLSWEVTLISLAVAFLLVCPFFLLFRLNYRLGKLNNETAGEIGCVMQESITSAKIILGFGNQEKTCNKFLQVIDAHCRVAIKTFSIIKSIPIMYNYLGLSVLIITMFSAQRLGVPLSETVALVYSLLKVIVSISRLAAYKNTLENFFPSYEQLLSLRSEAISLSQVTGEKKFTSLEKGIEIKNLSFSYPNNEEILKNININIPKSKMIAIVGKSGSGKSTLIDLIMGFYQPSKGEILLDGSSLKDFNINSYRHKIGYVPQENLLFNMTIKDNLLWANEKATPEELRDACKLANVDEFVEDFSDGYHTMVGERGVRLSGGQVQRITLVRAILRNPDLLIMDEATSSLDTYSERLIQKSIEDIAKQTTVIVIAHRLSTIVKADYIYVLKNGEIVEEGTYKELIGNEGEFYRMVKLQAL